MDWGKLAASSTGPASGLFYLLAVQNVRTVGERIGGFLSWLHEQNIINLSSTHIIGHSLGAHVAGWAGAEIYVKTGKNVGRITGSNSWHTILRTRSSSVCILYMITVRAALDPAGPAFYTGIAARTLNPQDATFIDVYHTSAGFLGIGEPIGTVDFFVNGGIVPQPGCLLESLGWTTFFIHFGIIALLVSD